MCADASLKPAMPSQGHRDVETRLPRSSSSSFPRIQRSAHSSQDVGSSCADRIHEICPQARKHFAGRMILLARPDLRPRLRSLLA